MKVSIRTARTADAQAVNEVYQHYIDHSVTTFNEINKTVTARAQEISELLRMYPFLIAEDEEGAFLGFACAEPVRSQTGYRFAAELTIYLHPDTPSGSGVGSQLYERLLSLLKQQGFVYAVGVVHVQNEASMRLHRRFGFTEAARLPRCAYKHGQWLDAAILVRQLLPLSDPPADPIPFPRLGL